MRPVRDLRLPAFACAGVFLCCILICWPFANMGVADDWSYIQIAQNLASTGHVLYNADPNAIIGWQLYLGAFFIKVFGASFTAPRLSTLLIGMAIAFLTQRILFRLGLNTWNATLGTLTLVLSPVFLPLSATFMTDVPGLFAILVSFYGCLRALQSKHDRSTIGWIVFAVLMNTVCGSSRQTSWLGVLVLVPSTLWLLRDRRSVLVSGIIATLCGSALILACIRWFAHQPYSLPEPFGVPRIDLVLIRALIAEAKFSLLTICTLLLPITFFYLWEAHRWPHRLQLAVLALAAVTGLIFVLHPVQNLAMRVEPLLGDWAGIHASFETTRLVGYPPIIIGPGLHTLLSLLSICLLFAVILTTALTVRRHHVGSAQSSANIVIIQWSQLRVLFGPFVVCYAIALTHRASVFAVIDRYLLPLFFVAICLLLRLYQDFIRDRLPSLAVPMLALIAFYGILCTHNSFALARARVALANEITAAGVPLSAVDAGWEQDYWVELQRFGYINDPRLINPSGAYNPDLKPGVPTCQEAYRPYVRSGTRLYAVSFDPNSCDGLAPFAPVNYSTWPLRNPTRLYVVKYLDPPNSNTSAINQIAKTTHKR
jgi:hypothetical protein